MEMVTVPVKIPKEMVSYIDWNESGLTFEQGAMLLYPLIQKLVISHGRAAEILGVSKLDLIEFYNSLGLPYLCQSRKELDKEIAGFEQLKGRMTQ